MWKENRSLKQADFTANKQESSSGPAGRMGLLLFLCSLHLLICQNHQNNLTRFKRQISLQMADEIILMGFQELLVTGILWKLISAPQVQNNFEDASFKNKRKQTPDQSLSILPGHKIKNTPFCTALKVASISESFWFFRLILNYIQRTWTKVFSWYSSQISKWIQILNKCIYIWRCMDIYN